jgi:hypothetical protein
VRAVQDHQLRVIQIWQPEHSTTLNPVCTSTGLTGGLVTTARVLPVGRSGSIAKYPAWNKSSTTPSANYQT